MIKPRRWITALLLTSLLLTSCGPVETTPDSMEVQNQINAAVAQTLSALTTSVAAVQLTDTAKPTETKAPTETKEPTIAPTTGLAALPAAATSSGPTKTSQPGACTDRASFVADITIPDGTMVPPGTQFAKTWSIRNAGSCTWTPEYSIVWTGGDMKGPSNNYPLTTANVLPGQTAHVTVTLTAPTNFIKYRSFWKLMNKNKQVFGIMDNTGKEQSIWAEIVVGNTYNFLANMCSATWTSSSGVLPCPGNKNDPRGFVYLNSAPAIEGGVKENDPAIIMVPPNEKDAYLVGQFPPIIVAEGSNLVLHFGCLEGYTKCNFRFRIAYSIEGGAEQELVNQVHGFGEWEYIKINLTQNNKYAMMNKATSFLFYVYPIEGSSDNYAFLFSPIMTTDI